MKDDLFAIGTTHRYPPYTIIVINAPQLYQHFTNYVWIATQIKDDWIGFPIPRAVLTNDPSHSISHKIKHYLAGVRRGEPHIILQS